MVSLSLATPDDAYAVASINYWAFKTTDNGPLRYGTADPEEFIKYDMDTRVKSILNKMQKKPDMDGITVRESSKDDHLSGQVIVVAKDDGTNEILGIAVWVLPPLDAHAEKNDHMRADTSARPSGLPEGANWEIIAHVLRLIDHNFEGLNTQPYFYLADLAVSPAAQGRGIGRKLVEWGMSRAQIDGTHVGLESSDKGYPVYIKLGFVEYAAPLYITEHVTMARMRWDPK